MQAAVAELLTADPARFDTVLERARATYRERADALAAALERGRRAPSRSTRRRAACSSGPASPMIRVDPDRLADDASAEGVEYARGSYFASGPGTARIGDSGSPRRRAGRAARRGGGADRSCSAPPGSDDRAAPLPRHPPPAYTWAWLSRSVDVDPTCCTHSPAWSTATPARATHGRPRRRPARARPHLHRFGIVNRIVSRPAAVYEEWVRPRLATTHAARLLDIGAGGGDLPRRSSGSPSAMGCASSRRDRPRRARRPLRGAPRRAEVPARVATTADLVAEGETFDVVWSNHVLHHLSSAEFEALLADTEQLVAPGGIGVHGDIERSRRLPGVLGGDALRMERARRSFIRPDGLTSIRRSHTAPELAAAIPHGWRVKRGFPSRLELVWGSEIPDD